MGLLKRKQKQPIRQLQSKNPTGLPTTTLSESETHNDSNSLIAAKAAAALSKQNQAESTKQSNSTNKLYTQSRPMSNTKKRLSAPPRPISMVISSSTSSARSPETHSLSHRQQLHQHSNLHNHHNEFFDSLNDFPHYVSDHLEIPNLKTTNLHVSNPIHNTPSDMSMKAAAVAAASASASNNLKKSMEIHELQPPAAISSPGFYTSSGGSSPMSSSDSLSQSLTLPMKLAELTVTRSKDSNKSIPKSYDHPNTVFEIEDLNKSKESLISEMEHSSQFIPLHSSDSFYYDSRYENQHHNMTDFDIPTNSAMSSRQNSSRPDSDSSVILSNKPPKINLTRKPPQPISPKSPQLQQINSVYDSPIQNLSRQRATSPRRKPTPIDYMTDTPDFTDSEFNLTSNDEADHEQHRYYLDLHHQTDPERHHSKRIGLRSNAKKLLKKGLKSTGAANSKTDSNLDKPVQLRSTLRKEKKDQKFNEDKPWKNHNDREFVTESERKRYEGVWVTNKGLYMEMVDPDTIEKDGDGWESNAALNASRLSTNTNTIHDYENELILNIVVREIWQRSRLPNDQLRQIWDLVDSRRDGFLDKKSFIVGMWFVDQCLYGRKLPKFAAENVWNSVSNVGVMNVVIKTKRK